MSNATLRALFVLGAVILLLGSPGGADDLVWSPQAGNDDWDTATANWVTDPGALSTTFTNGDNAAFEAPADTVNLAESLTAGDVAFSAAGYVLNIGNRTLTVTGAMTGSSNVTLRMSSGDTDFSDGHGVRFLGGGAGSHSFDGTIYPTNFNKAAQLIADGTTLNFGGTWSTSDITAYHAFSAVNNGKVVLGAPAQINNQWSDLIRAQSFSFISDGTGTMEAEAGYNADLGSQGDPQGGLSTLSVKGGTYITNASQNLPTVWKYTTDKTGSQHETHHGLLVFNRNAAGDASTWKVRSNSQMYDGGIYWYESWTLDVAAGLEIVSDTAYEQGVVGPHVGFGTRRGADAAATVAKLGDGTLVIGRGAPQGYRPDTTLDVQAGSVEFNSDPTQEDANYYLSTESGQNLAVQVADGAAVEFHSYTWPLDENWWTGESYGTDNLHRIVSLDAAGRVKLGGVDKRDWNGTIGPETAGAAEAMLQISGDATLSDTALFEIVLGAASSAKAVQAEIGGVFSQDGALAVLDDGTLAPGSYNLFDAESFAGDFDQLLFPTSAYQGSYNPADGVLTITQVPEPVLIALAPALVFFRRRRR